MSNEPKRKNQLIQKLAGLIKEVAGLKEEMAAKRILELEAANTKLEAENKKLLGEIEKHWLIEESQKESKGHYEVLLKALPVGLCQVYEDGFCFYANEQACRIMGLGLERILGFEWLNAIHPDDREKVQMEWLGCVEKRNFFKMEYRYVHPDGETIWVIGQAVPYLSKKGELKWYVGTFSDITGIKKIEEILRLSEERFSTAFNANPNPMFISTLKDGIFIDVNERFEKVSGCSREEIIGRTYLEMNFWGDFNDRSKAIMLLNERGYFHDLEVQGRLSSGELREGLLSAVACKIGTELCMIGSFNDITERKLAEKLLKESNKKYRYLVENAAAGIYEIDMNKLKFTSVNDVMCEISGYTKDELLLMSPFDILAEESKVDYSERIKMISRGEKVPENAEYKIIGKNGLELWVLISSRLIFEYGIPVRALVVVHDITARKNMEEELRRNEHFLEHIFESIQDRLSVIDKEFNIIRVNKIVEQMYKGYLPLEGKKCFSVYHGRDATCEECPGLTTLKTGKSTHAVIQDRDSKGNTTGWQDHYCYPLIDKSTGEVNGAIVYARDISDKIRTEKEMARLERLNLVGEMAASIGHEIRNPMTAVRGFLQMLMGKTECTLYRSYFDLMIEELDRANSIITEFLSLAKNKPMELKQTNLNSVINAILPLMEAIAINKKAKIDLDLEEIPNLPVNEKDIRQLIHNLVSNGLEAMPPGRKLTIKTYVEGEYVVLSVEDQGTGINPDLIDKIGTPFFTTKDNGTGLGLAVCYGIADRHNAGIRFETNSEGTVFFVFFRKAVG
ncbi:MAG: PAS domain S-box protein [Bacillota bacterium]